MSDSLAKPRVRLTLTPSDGGPPEERELPFVVGVIADLSAHRASGLPPLADREFVEIDRATFDRRLAGAAPRLTIRVPDRLTGRDEQFEVDLMFLKMSDFEPAGVARQLPLLRRLINDRAVIANSDRELREIDQRLSRQLAAVLHHPEFRKLERTWRGLEQLVGAVPEGSAVKVKVLNVDRATLAQDLAEADGFDQSVLFQKVYDEPLAELRGEAFGLLVGDEEFTRQPGDLELLRGIAGVAEFALAPFVAGAAPGLFGCERFADLPPARTLAGRFEGPEYAAWRSFRESEEARFVGLALPRVLGRAHYDPVTHPVGEFDFDEGVDGSGESQQLWVSGAWSVAARAVQSFAATGWFRGLAGPVEGLPAFVVTEHGRSRKQFAEAIFPDAAAAELAKLGFLPLVEQPGGPHLAGSASCQKPKLFHDPRVTAHAAAGARLDYLLSLARFPLLLKVKARAALGSVATARALEEELNATLGLYVLPGGESPARPLRDAGVQIVKSADATFYQAKIRLRPYYQIDEPDLVMNFQTEMPLRT
jgi:type VI secretion system protein ImpC